MYKSEQTNQGDMYRFLATPEDSNSQRNTSHKSANRDLPRGLSAPGFQSKIKEKAEEKLEK